MSRCVGKFVTPDRARLDDFDLCLDGKRYIRWHGKSYLQKVKKKSTIPNEYTYSKLTGPCYMTNNFKVKKIKQKSQEVASCVLQGGNLAEIRSNWTKIVLIYCKPSTKKKHTTKLPLHALTLTKFWQHVTKKNTISDYSREANHEDFREQVEPDTSRFSHSSYHLQSLFFETTPLLLKLHFTHPVLLMSSKYTLLLLLKRLSRSSAFPLSPSVSKSLSSPDVLLIPRPLPFLCSAKITLFVYQCTLSSSTPLLPTKLLLRSDLNELVSSASLHS